MSLRVRSGLRAPVAVCEAGHVEVVGEPERCTEILCDRCDQWTWADGNYCVRCGGALRLNLPEEKP